MTQRPDEIEAARYGGKIYDGPGSRAATGICLDGRYLLMDDDTTMPIVAMMDADGEDTEHSSECIGVVFQWPDGTFGVQDVRVFEDDARIQVTS